MQIIFDEPERGVDCVIELGGEEVGGEEGEYFCD